MKRMSLKLHILLMMSLAIILIILLVNVQSFDSSQPNRVHGLLDNLSQFDADSEQSMLQIFSRSQFDFDQLAQASTQMQRVHRQLIRELGEPGGYDDDMQALNQSVLIQQEGLNAFKSAFAIMSNSMRYLPLLSTSIVEAHPKLKSVMLQLKKDIYRWQLYPDDAAAMGRIRLQSKQAEAMGLTQLHQHIQAVLRYGPQVLAAIEKVTSCGIHANASALAQTYDRHYAAKVDQNNRNQMLLVLLGALLLIYLLALLVSKQRDAAKLADSEKRFRLLFELIPDGVGMHRDGRWIYCNSAAVRMFAATSADDIIGTPVLDRVHPDMRAEVVRRIGEEMQQNKIAPLMQQVNLRLDGSEFCGEVQGVPMMTDGEPVAMTVIRDVTARVQAETRTKQLAIAVEHTAEAVMISDAEALVEYVNPAFERLSGYTQTEVVGEFESLLHSGCHEQAFFKTICDTVAAGDIWTGDVIIKNKQGELITTERSVSPVMDADGKVVNHITVMRDVTEERETQAKMEHTQRLESLGILAGGIAHDFNNILTAIMGNAAMAARAMDASSTAKALLTRIELSTQRAADLCKQMLAYSGKGKFVVKTVNLSDQVEEMTRLMEVSIRKNVVIKYHLADSLPVVEADIAQLQQVIMNLITNANEAIGEKSGVISFSTGVMHADHDYLDHVVSGATLPTGRYVYIEVSDTGCGMDAATTKKMFDPFFTTKFTGRGLGMSAVLGIVRGHHGALRVYSEPGKGTTFKVLLPVSEQVLSEEEECEDAVICQFEGTILIVDDEETIREVAALMLEEMGFSTLSAENGMDALDVYRQHQHEIVGVLMDMTMPKMDGKACFRELRRINSDVKVILSSGYNEEEATGSFAGQGLAGFIQKPYSPEALQAIMQTLWEENHAVG